MDDNERTLDCALFGPAYDQVSAEFMVGRAVPTDPEKPKYGSVHSRIDKDSVTGEMHITTWAYGPSGTRLFVTRVPYK